MERRTILNLLMSLPLFWPEKRLQEQTVKSSLDTIASLEQSLLEHPQDAETHYLLGIEYGKLERYRDSVQAIQQALRLDPKCVRYHSGLGVTYGLMGQSQEEIMAYQNALAVDPEDAFAHYGLGAALAT